LKYPPLIALKFNLRKGDRLWEYYDDKKVAIITKGEGWKLRSEGIKRQIEIRGISLCS
jgi:hypothetical protein